MMARGPRYRVPLRRRREGKTDYQSRRVLIISGLPRLVVRGTLKHMITQVIEAKVKGDRVLVSAHSHELRKIYGWKGGCGNVSAAYLTGLLCGYRAGAHDVKRTVLDVGLHSPSRGARVFSALKGIIDSGIVIPSDESILPDEKRISGQHIVDYANILSSNPDDYQQRFRNYLLRGLRPEQLSEHFSLIKKKIILSFEGEKA